MMNRNQSIAIILCSMACFALTLPVNGAEKKWNDVQSWVYQLCNYKNGKLNEIADSKFDLAVIDLARDGESDYFKHEEIESVKKSKKIVLAYFEIGAIEDYRPEWNTISAELMAGKVGGWPKEQYVKFWDERWWPVVKGRVDQAINAGFDGAYLDLVTAYEEIPNSGMSPEERAHKMVDLIALISDYAKEKNPDFKIVPQNCPELYTWTPWSNPSPNQKYINAIDGIGIESVFYIAHDKPANKGWCKENRDNALAIKNAGKLVLGVDYAKKPESIAEAYKMQRAIGFVPYVSVVDLNAVFEEIKAMESPESIHAKTKPQSMGLLVPAYFYPEGKGLSLWERLFEASNRAPITAIVNPANGPGEKPDDSYTKIVERAEHTNTRLIGYVSSSYAKRPLTEVKQDIDKWINYYPKIQGIFIDEQASDGRSVDYYSELYKYIRESKGLKLVVANPGTVCAEGYFSSPAADVICLHESDKDVDDSFFPAWAAKYPSTSVLILKYGVSTEKEMLKWVDFAAKNRFCSIYFTDDRGKNPWDSLPGSWGKEVDAVVQQNSLTGK